VFDKLQDFFPKHKYGKIAATVQTTWIPIQTPSSIRQVSHSKSRRPDTSQHGSDLRASSMEIECIKSTVRTTIPSVQTREAFISATVQTTGHHHPDAAKKQERISAKFSGNRSHNCPSGRPVTTVWTGPSFYQARCSFEP